MKKLLLFTLFSVIADSGYSQAIRWANKTTSPGMYAEQAYGIATDSFGNSYITGSYSDTAYFGSIFLKSNGGKDVFVAKMDTSGNYVWAKSFGGTGTDEGYAITLDNSGNVFITGYFSSKIFFTPVDSFVSVGGTDIFVTKLDSSGNLLLKIQEGNTTNDYGRSIAVNNVNGNFAIVGDQSNNVYFCVRKYNSAGSPLFSKLFGATTVTGTFSGGLGAAIEGRDIGDGMEQGFKYGAAAGLSLSVVNIGLYGAAYIPDKSYGNFGRNGPLYRRGTPITKAFNDLLGQNGAVTLGRNCVMNTFRGRYFYEAHETGHFQQEIEMGFGNFYARTAYEYLIDPGFNRCRTTLNTLEFNADRYANNFGFYEN